MKLEIDVESYTGPFDVLLKLIEKEKLDIYDIKIEDITNSYLEEIKKMDIGLEELSEFIYISSILLSIKARKLLPKEEDDTLEEDFLGYLLEYKKIKGVEDDLKFLEEESKRQFSKYQEDLSKYSKEEEIIASDINILTKEFQNILLKFSEKDENEKQILRHKEIDVNDYVEKIRKNLNFSTKLRLDDITREIKDKKECIVTFLALLELVRTKEITLKEEKVNFFFFFKR